MDYRKAHLKFGYDLAGLSEYSEQVGGPMMVSAILESNDFDSMTVVPGVKFETELNLLSGDLVAQSGFVCGWNPSTSDTEFTQETLKVAQLSYQEELCPSQLQKYWLGQKLASREEVPFMDTILEFKAAQIGQLSQKLAFTAVDATDGFDGFIVRTTSANGAILPTGLPASFTSTNALEYIDAMIEEIPDNASDKAYSVYMSIANLRKYTIALRNANFYDLAYSPKDGTATIVHPGTTITIHGVQGLNGSERIFLNYSDNMVIGVDGISEEENLEMYWDKSDRVVKATGNWAIGAAIPFIGDVVTNDAA